SGELAFDAEEPDLPEIEKLLVETRPFVHAPAMDIVGEMIDVIEPNSFGARIALADPVEIDLVDRAFLAIAIDKIDLQTADAFDGGNVELDRPDPGLRRLGAERQGPLEGVTCIDHAKGHGGSARSMLFGKALRKRALLGIDDEVYAALAIES